MSKYDILLSPTRVTEEWHEVPRVVTCGKTKKPLKTWEELIECSKDFKYSATDENTMLYKKLNKNTTIEFTKNNGVFINGYYLTDMNYNKMLLFMLLLENKI